MRGARFMIPSAPRAGRGGVTVGFSLSDAVNVFVPLVPILRGDKRELSDEEIRDSAAAGRRAIDELVAGRSRMLKGWDPSMPLTTAQMGPIMSQALLVARTTEANMVAMIDKVPSHWEKDIRQALPQLRQAIEEAPRFDALVNAAKQPTVIPGFRTWIDHLLSRSESGVYAVAATAQILPDWLRAASMLSGMHKAANGLIELFIAAAKGAGEIVTALPSALPKIGIAVAAILGGVVVVGAIASGSKSK